MNRLTDPNRRPAGYVALCCDHCGGFIAWCWPPVPPVPVVCGTCSRDERDDERAGEGRVES